MVLFLLSLLNCRDKVRSLKKRGGDDLSKDDAIINYNYYLKIVIELLKRIIAADGNSNIQYVFVEGERIISYVVWDYEFTENDRARGFSLNLLRDGRLIFVSRSGIHKKDKPTDLYFVDNPSEMFYVQIDCIHCTLADIYNSIYERRNDFGITFDSDWPNWASDFYISHL